MPQTSALSVDLNDLNVTFAVTNLHQAGQDLPQSEGLITITDNLV
jgi:hypothetical protein